MTNGMQQNQYPMNPQMAQGQGQGLSQPPGAYQQQQQYPAQQQQQQVAVSGAQTETKKKKDSLPMVSFYPHIYLVSFIVFMIGIVVVFIGVMMIGDLMIDMGSDDAPDGEEFFEDMGSNIRMIAMGGLICAGGFILKGVAKFFDGQMDMRDRIKF